MGDLVNLIVNQTLDRSSCKLAMHVPMKKKVNPFDFQCYLLKVKVKVVQCRDMPVKMKENKIVFPSNLLLVTHGKRMNLKVS